MTVPRQRVQVQVFPAYRKLAPLPWLRQAAAAALAVAGAGSNATASLVIADDATLRDLNQRFRGLDEVTDVLSFGRSGEADRTGEAGAPEAAGSGSFVFPETPEEEGMMGEVVISYPQAARQAVEHGWGAEQELALLLVHGILHLFGLDHAELEEEEAMRALEEQALARLGATATTGQRR